MAKSRAQRKAERKKREARQAAQAGQARTAESRAQHDTQVPESADVVEAELAEQGADLDALKEEQRPEAPAPSRADVGQPDAEPAEEKLSRREQRRQAREERERAKASEERRRPKDEPVDAAYLGVLDAIFSELVQIVL
jgi:hypothetical protein